MIPDLAGVRREAPAARSRRVVISALGVTQILAWGSSYYLPAVLAKPIATDTGWSFAWVVGGLSIGLLTSGFVSPLVGRRIQSHGGRPILIASSLLLASGLVLMGTAQHLALYLLAWILVGLGMGAGLYDPAFATLGRLYGADARSAITVLTLFGGFASTVCWPLSAFFAVELGWRGACLAYAGLHVMFALPIYLLALPREARAAALPVLDARDAAAVAAVGPVKSSVSVFALVAATITLSATISTVMSVHMLTILQSGGLTLAAAVTLGALVGPSQVGARFIEMLIARFHHPIWTKLASTSLVAAGLLALWAGLPIMAVPLILYGAGIGLESIARGTLPLALFGPVSYPRIMGQLAMPSLMAQALAPSIGAALLDRLDTSGALAVLVAAAIGNVMMVALLFALARQTREGSA